MSQPNLVDVGANAADRARNRGMGAGLVDDPYPIYDALRESGPVHEGAISEKPMLRHLPFSTSRPMVPATSSAGISAW